MKKQQKFYALCLTAIAIILCSCGGNKQKEIVSEADLPGARIGCNAGSIYEIQLAARSDIKLSTFNCQADCIEALSKGKIDVMLDDDCVMSPDSRKRLGIKIAFKGEDGFECGLALRKNDQLLCESLSYFIDSLRKTGELQAIYERWFLCDTPSLLPMPNLGQAPTGKPIVVGEAVNIPPTAFPVEQQWHGFEPELLERFARYAGRPVEIMFIPINGAVAALQSGNIDILAGGVFITDERRQTMLFTSSHFSSYPAYFVKDRSDAQNSGFVSHLKQSVYNNLVVENRWRYITDGLLTTIVISVFAILLGSILGAAICWMRMSRRRWLSRTAKIYVDVMRGIPMLVFLMIMFYVVFASTGVGAVTVAVISFAFNFAAYVSEMFRTAIQSVGKGQIEAGLATGFTRVQTFFYIVFPQALRNVMPVYKGEAVSLIKNTSIVGYIAIHDLTRASDMIRSRTFDALFPLLIITIIYFILTWLLGKLLDSTVSQKNTKK
ncbi:MAG: ABC transporter permease subunit [Bacteroidales bacterium]|nr:ABC transporter permease subunit [Bacteroidales bacterium]